MSDNKPKKPRTPLGDSLQDAISYIEGKPFKGKITIVYEIDVKAIRTNTGLSQAEFAKTFGIPLQTLQGWEQGRRSPDATAVAYLESIAHRPRIMKSIRKDIISDFQYQQQL